MRSIYSGLIVMLISSSPCLAEVFSGRVISVTDGDTIKVMHNGQSEKIRLNGIDAPEHDQAFGAKSKSYAASLCFDKKVTVTTHGHDRYRRTIGDVELPDGKLLNNELVRTGLAWWYRKYASGNSSLQQLEQTARLGHCGLWTDTNPTPPWEFRHVAINRLQESDAQELHAQIAD